jgi:hypothetical protein
MMVAGVCNFSLCQQCWHRFNLCWQHQPVKPLYSVTAQYHELWVQAVDVTLGTTALKAASPHVPQAQAAVVGLAALLELIVKGRLDVSNPVSQLVKLNRELSVLAGTREQKGMNIVSMRLADITSMVVSRTLGLAATAEHGAGPTACSAAATGSIVGRAVPMYASAAGRTCAVPLNTRCSFHVQCSSHSAEVRLHGKNKARKAAVGKHHVVAGLCTAQETQMSCNLWGTTSQLRESGRCMHCKLQQSALASSFAPVNAPAHYMLCLLHVLHLLVACALTCWLGQSHLQPAGG